MQIQHKYDQTIYNLTQLILKKKYRRVIRIAEHLQSQGINTHELTVITSYAIFLSQGPNAALVSLQNHSSPLVHLAESQYQQILGHWEEAGYIFKKLKAESDKTAVGMLSKSNNLVMVPQSQQIDQFEEYTSDHVALGIDRKQQETVALINQVTKQYEQCRDQQKKGQIEFTQFQAKCVQCKAKFQQIYKQGKPRHEIKTTLNNFITFLNTIIEKNIL